MTKRRSISYDSSPAKGSRTDVLTRCRTDAQVFPVGSIPIGRPRLKPSLDVELISKVDVRLAIQQSPEIHTKTFQVDGVDLEVAPVKSAVGVVVVGLAI